MKDNRGCYSYYIIETCTKDELTEKEQFYIKKLGADANGYNHLIVYKTEEEKQESRLQWKKAHREEIKDRSKQWREQNPDYLKTYYQENKQRINERNKQYCKEHPEVRKAIEERRKEKRKEYLRKWRENHPDYFKQYKEKGMV